MREKRKNPSNLPWILACVLVVLALLVLVIALRHPAQAVQQPARPAVSVPEITPSGTPQNVVPASPQNGTAAEDAKPGASETEAGTSAAERVEPVLPGESDIPAVPAEPVPGEEDPSGKTPASPEEPQGSEDPSTTEPGNGSPVKTEGESGETPSSSEGPIVEPGETEPGQPVVIPQAVGSSYERKLAAAGIMGLLMYAEDPDFSIDAVFLTGETPVEEYLESGGIYVIFTDSERTRCLFCAPLPAERTEPGTVDMKSADLGWASFTYLDSMDPTGCIEVSVDDLEEELNQAMLVTLSEH